MTPAPVDRRSPRCPTSVFALFTGARRSGLRRLGVADRRRQAGTRPDRANWGHLFAMSLGSVLAPPSTGKLIERFGLPWKWWQRSTAWPWPATGILVIGPGVDVAHSRALLMVGSSSPAWGGLLGCRHEPPRVRRRAPSRPGDHAALPRGLLRWDGGLGAAGCRAVPGPVSASRPHGRDRRPVVVIGAWSAFALAARRDGSRATAAHHAGAGTKAASAWTEPRTLLIGFVVLVAAFTEGRRTTGSRSPSTRGSRPADLGRCARLRNLLDVYDGRPPSSAPACSTGTAGCRASGQLLVWPCWGRF